MDDEGRITLPKRLREGVRNVVLIPAGSHMVLIPLRGPGRWPGAGSGWGRAGGAEGGG